jgi:hypothetical protein
MTDTQQGPGTIERPAVDIHNPVAVETEITAIHARLYRGVEVIDKLNREHKKLARDLTKAKAKAYLEYDGPQPEKRQHAELATLELREQVDTARVKLDYARDFAHALGKEMSGLQSILSDLRAMYGAERGRG